MSVDFNHLRILIDVARLGSFVSAARAHEMDPSAVSRVVATVEESVGARLFQRSTRRVTLTEAGAQFVQRIGSLVDEFDAAAEDARNLSGPPAGTLRMTASVAFGHLCLVPLLPAFREQYPDVRLELLFTDLRLDLIAERIDLAIRLGPRPDSDLIATRLIDTRYRVCASPEYLRDHPDIKTPMALMHHRCLRFTLPEFRNRWRFRPVSSGEFTGKDSEADVINVNIDGDICCSSALALREAALAGLGPTLLANWTIDTDIANGRLVDLFPDYYVSATDGPTAAWLIYPSRAYLPGKVRVMVDFLKARLQ